MADITITIQAASDSEMTENNLSNGTALGEGDARKVYGLPNIATRGLTDTAGVSPTEAPVIQWITSPRWDKIHAPGRVGNLFDDDGDLIDRKKVPPTTTAFQLHCESISHEFTDNVAVSPIPAFDISPGQNDNAGTPGQLNMIVLALGMRTELIKLSGVLVDRGLVTASNPRRQVLLNIARTQHYKTGRGGQGGSKEKTWGGSDSGALNIRSYPCLTIFEALASPGFSMGVEPSGDPRHYRGIIKDLSFRIEGGRPDHWFWNMTFAVISNEHTDEALGAPQWLSDVNRIRLVTTNDGEGVAVASDADGYIEVRSAKELVLRNADGSIFRQVGGTGKFEQFGDDLEDTVWIPPEGTDSVYLSNTDSTPTINGYWEVVGVNVDNKTFIIQKPSGHSNHGEAAVMTHDNNEGTLGELKWNEANFTAGDSGHISWGLLNGTGFNN